MFAARDQENLVHGHQQVAAAKPHNQGTRSLQPKTPGNRFPKTPLKIPLNDENAPGGYGGKGTVLGTKGKGKGLGGKDAFATPVGTGNRAPLGMKTTNAKTKVFQTPAGPTPDKELEKTASRQMSARRPKPKVSQKIKIDVHGDESPLRDVEVEYMPPRSKDLPFDSDVFPIGCLNYDMLKPENLTNGALGDYYNTNDKSGRSQLERDLEKSAVERAKKTDEQILASMEDWVIGDVPETFRNLKKQKPKPTITARRATSALSTLPRSRVEPLKRPSTAIPRPA
ncbi:hypothetical protein SBOR_5005 [Sclerotinia borealis F-4128]|uniref:Uncharacterized protein n=1 Tax=Sclerotinia borealis (strain F-4128) TaxID=1432307 RepID=W9CIT2_SCLBF|nr:hypothetical protein SBOR_5005 [Sclerotinia borealis F-4128]